jgi:hypothetical protein
VQIGNNQVLPPGTYEIEGVVTSGGDAQRLTKEDIQQGISSQFGGRVQVVDYVATDKQDITLKIQVLPGPNAGDITPQQVVAIITALAIVAAGFLLWQFSIQVKKTFKVIDDTTHSPGGQIAAGGVGVGIAALGLAALAYMVWPRKGKRHG